MNAQEIIDMENRYVLQTYGRADFVLDHGAGVYLYDTNGKAYLDFVGGIAVNALGYGDPEVLAAIQEQSQKLIHVSNLYQTIPQAYLAKMLVEHSFADRVFFCNSGTEAVEAALKFARKHSLTRFGVGKHEVVAFTGSFHGRTLGALATTSREKYRKPFEPLMPGAQFATFNDLDSARKVIGNQTCAVMVEPVQGEGGIHIAGADFLRGLRKLCNDANALLILDEVQCGLGRTGYLWAHEYYGITPDIMTLAKPLGGGLPMGATLVTQAVADTIERGDHGSTFAANCLVAAVAQVVFRRVSDPAFLAAIKAKGEYLRTALKALQTRNPGLVRDIRGRGLIWGLETPLKANDVVKAGYEQRIIVATAGDDVVRLVPPLIVEKAHIDDLVAKLEIAFRAASNKGDSK
jgi:acetylornithine/N-succinyldiaminopimelate aminotransferase